MAQIEVDIKGKAAYKATPRGPFLFIKQGGLKRLWVDEACFDESCMTRVDALPITPQEAPIVVSDEKENVPEEKAPEVVEPVQKPVYEGQEVNVSSLKKDDLHAYARSKGVDPEGKTMKEIREELGAE